MTYYLGYYLPAGFVGRLAGWQAANQFLALWTVLGLSVVEQRETPSWFSRVIGSDYAEKLFGKSYADSFELGSDVDGVTGATYTSRAIADAVHVPVIASGGVGTLDHLVEGVTEGGASAVLAASIFHFGDFTIREAKEHMAAAGVPVRLN